MRLGAALRSELSKLFRQRVTYAGFAVVVVLVSLLTWGTYHEKGRLTVERNLGSDFIVAGKSVTALFVAHAAMDVAMVILLPVLVAFVLGGLVSGETQTATLRTLLTRPVARSVVLLSKLITGWAYAIAVTIFLGLSGLAIGYAVFGWGDLVIFRGSLLILEPTAGLVRLIQAYGLAAYAMCAVGAIAIMLSVIFDNPLMAAGLTIVLLVVSGTVQLIPYFEKVKPYLLTTNVALYQKCLRASVDSAAISTAAWYLLAYLVVATTIALLVFGRRDVTC